MLGRLARYLRFVGCDTLYLQGRTDGELLEIARREGRVLLTRDRQLGHRSSSAFLVESPMLAEQWRAVRRAWPSIPTTPSFDRCTLCNGVLRQRSVHDLGDDAGELPASLRSGHGVVHVCEGCRHVYWDGSHTARIRDQIAAWEQESRR